MRSHLRLHRIRAPMFAVVAMLLFLKRLIPAVVCTTLAALSFAASAAPFAYVTNFNSDTISVIDTASNTVAATVPVPASHWPGSVAINPDGTRVYITSGKWPGGNIGRVSVIDTATNAVTATVEVGDYQGGIALNPAGTRAYVSYTGMRSPNVSVIDTASNTVVATVPLAIPYQGGEVVYPAAVAVNPAGTRVYVVQGYQDGGSVGAIYVIDTASNTVVDVLVMGSPMGYIVFNHAGTRAYVARAWGPSVSVIDTSTNTIVGTIPVAGGYPTFVAIAPDDTRLYVSNINDGLNPSVSVIDLTSNTVVATVLVGGVPYGVAVNAAGTFAYVPVANKNFVAVIDTRTNTVVGTVVVGTSPASIAIGPPELADAGRDQTVNEGAAVTLDGSGSAQGESITYSWRQVAGPAVSLSGADTAQPSFVAPQLTGGFGSQTLSFQLTVSSGSRSSTAVTNVIVVNVNHAPVADAGSAISVLEGASVTLSGANSYDPDLDPITYSWTQISGPAVQLSSTNTASTSFFAPVIGGAQNSYADLIFALTVSDGALSHATPVTVRVERVNHPPVASAGQNATVRPGTTVTLSGSASDPDGDPLTFTWTQIAGPTVTLNGGSGLTPSFVAPPTDSPMQLTFRLVASDGLLASNPSDVTVTVVNNQPVCTAAFASPSELWPPNHLMVPVRIVGVTDRDNDQISVRVTGVLQDEPTNGTGDGDTAPDAVVDGSNLFLRAERAGTGDGRVYIVSFSAQDGSGSACTGSVRVSVPKNKSDAGRAIDSGNRYNSMSN